MAAEKKATIEKSVKKAAKEYKVVGDKFESKKKAEELLKKAAEKGFKGAGLIVQGTDFRILFDTYGTLPIAEANMESVKKSGFNAEIMEI